MKSAKVSVIIPVFNKFSLTRDCLHSLCEHAPDVGMEVIVVDNGSSDETVTELDVLGRTLFGDAFIPIHLSENRNFGPACNVGALAASGEYVFFLNNDTILTEGWLPPLLDGLTGNCGMTGPLLMYPESSTLLCDRVQHLGVACKPQLHPCHLYELFPVTHAVARKKRILQFLTGAAFLLPKTVFSKAGMFHEEYINGGEDLDLCVQVRRNGYTLQCVPESRIYHLQSQTPGRHDHEKHNGSLFKKRCLPDLYPDLHLHVVGDGYELALNGQMAPFVRLPQRRNDLLTRAFFKDSDTPDAAACRDMVEREPLFAPGYERWAALCEVEGDFKLLTKIRLLQSKLFPSKNAGYRLQKAAAKADMDDMKREGERVVSFYENLEQDSDLPSMAREMVEYGKHVQQPVITKLYTDWLAETGSQEAVISHG